MSTFAIIVTFNPSLNSIEEMVNALSSQVESILLVDNFSKNKADLINYCKKFSRVELHCLSENFGIAKAQNTGLIVAREKKARYVIFFDQDSKPEKDIVRVLRDNYLKLSSKENVAAVAPIYKDSRYGFIYPSILIDKFGFRKKVVPRENSVKPISSSLLISSGTFTSMSTIDDVGLMREDFFIDYVDTEWCLRALNKGYVFYSIPQVCMSHAIGDKFISVFGLRIPVHSPFRRYYRIRNAFYLLRLDHVPKILSIREILFNFTHQLILIVTQKEKMKNAKCLIAALKDGVFIK